MSPIKKTTEKPTIVLVEDDSFLAGMYVAKLELEDYDVKLATDGESGLELVRKEKPDVVLLDVVLPGIDGFDVLTALKKDPQTKNIPVLLLTNLGQRADVQRGLELGAIDYLIKAHFMPSEVIEKIKNIVVTHGERY